MKGSSHTLMSITAGILCTNACSLSVRLVHLSGGESLFGVVSNPYRPEQHYMRGPGPKWRAKHQLVD